MDLLDFFIFERSGKLLFRNRFTADNEAEAEDDERDKLVYGLLFSFKQLIPLLSRDAPLQEEGIRSFSTSTYTLHCLETATGYRLVLITSPCGASPLQQAEVRRVLDQRVFQALFVDLVMLDPTYVPKTRIESPEFAKQVSVALESLRRKQ